MSAHNVRVLGAPLLAVLVAVAIFQRDAAPSRAATSAAPGPVARTLGSPDNGPAGRAERDSAVAAMSSMQLGANRALGQRRAAVAGSACQFGTRCDTHGNRRDPQPGIPGRGGDLREWYVAQQLINVPSAIRA
jgi:hypothetical protein